MRKKSAKPRKKRHTRTAIIPAAITPASPVGYGLLVSEISNLLDESRRQSVRSVNALLSATYWQIGWRIVEHEQGGKERAGYGDALLDRLAVDLTDAHGRGFSRSNVAAMRAFC